MESGPTAFGQKPIVILAVEGVERSLWITTDPLRSKLADELERRGARSFDVGEQIVITREAEKRISSNDRAYWAFKATFPDSPARDAADLLGAHIDQSLKWETTTVEREDEIPF